MARPRRVGFTMVAPFTSFLRRKTVAGPRRYSTALTITAAIGLGTIFELSPNSNGTWSEKVSHGFGSGSDGFYPQSMLVMDAMGNLYGTTNDGGIYPCTANGNVDCGTVFELSPRGNGSWTEAVVHNFGNGTDGQNSIAGLVFDRVGNLYGTTYWGGIHGYGTVFEMSPRAGGGWTETVLHSFNDNGIDAVGSAADLPLDSSGNIYGATAFGGSGHLGAVFEITP